MHQARVEEPSALSEGKQQKVSASKYHVGCSGWFYWHWKGDFYPAELSTNQWFPHYMKNFSTVELNAPFYAWPTVATVQNWRKQLGRSKFIYTVKVCELR